uniref:Uncharacterized protein n=1 Tax=Arundo donax TaxID=35708 RepID=A0A0A9C0A5_ARUDO
MLMALILSGGLSLRNFITNPVLAFPNQKRMWKTLENPHESS